MEQISKQEMEQIIAQAVAKIKRQSGVHQSTPAQMPQKNKSEKEQRKEDALDLAELVYATFDRQVASVSMEQKG